MTLIISFEVEIFKYLKDKKVLNKMDGNVMSFPCVNSTYCTTRKLRKIQTPSWVFLILQTVQLGIPGKTSVEKNQIKRELYF